MFQELDDLYGAIGYGGVASGYVLTRLMEEKLRHDEKNAPKLRCCMLRRALSAIVMDSFRELSFFSYFLFFRTAAISTAAAMITTAAQPAAM